MKWSIIIPSYLVTPKLVALETQCVESLRKTTKDEYEIIIVESGDFEIDDDINTHIMFLGKQTPFAKAVNIGVRRSEGEYIVVCNNDTVHPYNWQQLILNTFDSGPDCVVASIMSTEWNQPVQNDITEGYFGGFWCIKRKDWERVGELDERFIMSFEDADYWLRVRELGGKVLMNRFGQITHHARQSVDLDTDKHMEQYYKNKELFNQKWKFSQDEWFERLR